MLWHLLNFLSFSPLTLAGGEDLCATRATRRADASQELEAGTNSCLERKPDVRSQPAGSAAALTTQEAVSEVFPNETKEQSEERYYAAMREYFNTTTRGFNW